MNMPTVAVHDLQVHPRENDLIAATHGRGFWIMDDISPLQQMTPEVQKAEAYLFKNRVATEWLSIQPQYNGGQLAFMGQNPTKNAIINYYLSPQVTGDVRFEITSADGASSCIATMPGTGRHRPAGVDDAVGRAAGRGAAAVVARGAVAGAAVAAARWRRLRRAAAVAGGGGCLVGSRHRQAPAAVAAAVAAVVVAAAVAARVWSIRAAIASR